MVEFDQLWPKALTSMLRPTGALDYCENASLPTIPFRSAAFDVILNRHEAFDAFEVRRIFKPGGIFLTEQVGSDEAASVRAQSDPIEAVSHRFLVSASSPPTD
jgi:hypothetical protein